MALKYVVKAVIPINFSPRTYVYVNRFFHFIVSSNLVVSVVSERLFIETFFLSV